MYDAGILTVLAELTPFDPVAASAVTVRVTNRDDARACILNSQTWWPAMTRAPRLDRRLFDGAFSGQIGSSAGDFALSLAAFPDAMRYEWAERPAKLWIGRLGDGFGSYTLLFEGVMTGLTGEGASAAVGLRVNDGWMDGPLLTASYAGTGGAEGMAALKGQPKPLAIGAPRYAEGVLIDDVNCVYQLHGYGPMEGVEFALDSLVRFPAAAGNDASYAALVAATIAPGTVRTSTSVGMVRHGAPVEGVASYLIKGDNTGAWHRRPGAVIARLAGVGGASGGQIESASMTALDTAVAYDISLHLTDQVTVRGAVQEIAASCNAAAGVNWLGKLVVAKVGIAGTADLTLKSDGSALPPCGLPARLPVDSPFHKMRMSAVHAQRPHGPDEIAFTAQIIDTGAYDNARTYREGNLVTGTNGRRYLYISPTPTSGNAPPNVTYWSDHDATLAETIAELPAAGNLLPSVSAQFEAAGWTVSNTGSVATAPVAAGSGWAEPPQARGLLFDLSASATFEDAVSLPVPVVAGGRVHVQFLYATKGTALGALRCLLYYRDVDGAFVDSSDFDVPQVGGGTYALYGFSDPVPEGAATVELDIYKPAVTSSGEYRFGKIFVTNTALNADVTSENNAGGLIAGSRILQNGAPSIQAGASPFEISVVDGDVITFSPQLAVTPKASFELTGLPTLASGETYSARAETLTGTGCTVRVKKRTSGGSVSTLSTGTGSVITTDLEYQVSKGDSRDARDHNYKMRLKGKVRGTYSPAGGGWFDYPLMIGGMTIEIFAMVSAAWQSCGVFTITPPYGVSALHDFDETFTFACANTIGNPAGNEFRALVTGRVFTADDKLTELTSVTWQVDGSTPTETAVTQAVTMRVQPQNV